MKRFAFILATCLVAVSTFPDELLKLSPDGNQYQWVESPVSVEADIATEAPPNEVLDFSTPSSLSTGSTVERTRLAEVLFKGYNKIVNPDGVNVDFGITMMNLNVIEKDNKLESNVWFSEVWNDSRLAWDPEEYGGVKSISYDSDLVWKPDITLYNSADPVNMLNCWKTNVVIKSNGEVHYIPPCKMVSICTLLKLRKEPYSPVTCSFKFGSWTYDGNTMDVNFQNDMAKIDLSEMKKNQAEFEISENVAEKHVRHYKCCPEPYTDLTYNVTLTRVPGEEMFKRL